MIFILEGNQCSGKTTLAILLKIRLLAYTGIDSFIVKAWKHNPFVNEEFRNSNPFMNVGMEDALESDFLLYQKFDLNFIFDRSMPSAVVYDWWRNETNQFNDMTLSPKLIDIWFNNIINSANGPTIIIHLINDYNICVKRACKLEKKIVDISNYYNRFYYYYRFRFDNKKLSLRYYDSDKINLDKLIGNLL